jgi:transcriptional regulator GlxA family with amidase domain
MNGKISFLRAAFFIFLACLPFAAAAKETDMQVAAQPAAQEKVLGVLVYPGFEMLDAYGPMEMWGNLRHAPASLWGGPEKRVAVRVVTIGAQRGEFASFQGPKTVADYGYADAPRLDYLLVPGGMGAVPLLQDKTTLNWLKARAKQTPLVMSVCNGASLLAAAGLLDGRPATTNKMFWKMSTDPGPRVKWVKQARWVDDGAIVTSSGISAGMDMSLAVIARLYGQQVADWLAQLTEYDAHRNPAWDPFAVKAGLVE